MMRKKGSYQKLFASILIFWLILVITSNVLGRNMLINSAKYTSYDGKITSLDTKDLMKMLFNNPIGLPNWLLTFLIFQSVVMLLAIILIARGIS